jgi:hypothetical protein
MSICHCCTANEAMHSYGLKKKSRDRDGVHALRVVAESADALIFGMAPESSDLGIIHASIVVGPGGVTHVLAPSQSLHRHLCTDGQECLPSEECLVGTSFSVLQD